MNSSPPTEAVAVIRLLMAIFYSPTKERKKKKHPNVFEKVLKVLLKDVESVDKHGRTYYPLSTKCLLKKIFSFYSEDNVFDTMKDRAYSGYHGGDDTIHI